MRVTAPILNNGYEIFKKEKSHAKAQRRKVFPAISRLNQFNYRYLQHLVRPRITKVFLYFLFLRLCVRFLKSLKWQMRDAQNYLFVVNIFDV